MSKSLRLSLIIGVPIALGVIGALVGGWSDSTTKCAGSASVGYCDIHASMGLALVGLLAGMVLGTLIVAMVLRKAGRSQLPGGPALNR